MAISRYSVRTKAKQLAQDAGPGDTSTGVQLLLTDPGDYDTAILQALRLFAMDRVNRRIVDSVLDVDHVGFRQILAGYLTIGFSQIGPIPGLAYPDSGISRRGDEFLPDISKLQRVWFPYDATQQGITSLDDEDWRLVTDPTATILEFLEASPAQGQTIRLEFTSPHELTEAENIISNPTAEAVAALVSPAAPGNIDNGAHSWSYCYVTAHGTTLKSTGVTVTVVDKTVNGQVSVTVPACAQAGVIGVNIGRTVAGDFVSHKLVGYLAGNGGTFLDNVADSGLGAILPSSFISVDDPLAINDAGGFNTVRDRDEDLIAMLSASIVLELAAVKSAQNTGNTGLPNDVVDRRTQSDIFRSRSRELKDLYNTLVGKGPKSDVTAASGTRDLNVRTSWGGRFLTHDEQ